MFFSCRVSVTAITLVAVGTSLPDLLASKQAVTDSTNADAAVGNVTGSNSVNVFLGLGLPWLLASVYYAMNGQRFCYPVSTGCVLVRRYARNAHSDTKTTTPLCTLCTVAHCWKSGEGTFLQCLGLHRLRAPLSGAASLPSTVSWR